MTRTFSSFRSEDFVPVVEQDFFDLCIVLGAYVDRTCSAVPVVKQDFFDLRIVGAYM